MILHEKATSMLTSDKMAFCAVVIIIIIGHS